MYKEDGVDHINIYSKGQTELGRLLSNFAHTPFELPQSGKFASIEAYWYWCILDISCSPNSFPTKDEINKLRNLHGFAAKKVGKSLLFKYLSGGAWLPEQEAIFKQSIKNAFCAKLNYNKQIIDLLRDSRLPFTHYYQYGEKVIEPKAHKWQVDFWENIRNQIKIETLMWYIV